MSVELNTKKLKNAAWFAAKVGIGALLITGVAKCTLHDIEQKEAEDKRRADYRVIRDNFNRTLGQLSRIRSNGQTYALTGGHTVETSDGNVKYVLNFRTRLAAIDGPGNADKLVSLNDAHIRPLAVEGHRVVCQLTREDASRTRALAYTFNNGDYNQRKATVLANRPVFQANYCRGGYDPLAGV